MNRHPILRLDTDGRWSSEIGFPHRTRLGKDIGSIMDPISKTTGSARLDPSVISNQIH